VCQCTIKVASHTTSAPSASAAIREPGAAAQQARNALLEQQALDEFGLGEVARPGHADQAPFGELRLDLPRPVVAVIDLGRSSQLRLLLDERQAAGRAEPVLRREARSAAGADQRLGQARRPAHQLTSSSASETCPSRIS
jgi:hypothetical protein